MDAFDKMFYATLIIGIGRAAGVGWQAISIIILFSFFMAGLALLVSKLPELRGDD